MGDETEGFEETAFRSAPLPLHEFHLKEGNFLKSHSQNPTFWGKFVITKIDNERREFKMFNILKMEEYTHPVPFESHDGSEASQMRDALEPFPPQLGLLIAENSIAMRKPTTSFWKNFREWYQEWQNYRTIKARYHHATHNLKPAW